MENLNIDSLTTEEKIRFFNGQGWWKTYTANGKLPSITMSDGPHGLRKQDDTDFSNLNNSNIATCFPTASCMASSWDRECFKLLGKAIALEAQKEKVNMVLGPGINIKRSPLCGRNFEYLSEDPYLAGHLSAEYVKGMQAEGVSCCLKHFACNNQEKRRQTSSSMVDERTLNEIYLSAFEYVVKEAKPMAIMCSYNKLNGTYVSHNKKLLTDILRTRWNFDGAVVSDWGACIKPSECIKAGLDLAMPDSSGYFDSQIKKALEKNEITIEEIEQANKRVLNLIQKLKATEKENATVDYEIQHKTAVKLAESSAVLLKNNGFFPVPKGKILVIGQMAETMRFQGGGSSHINSKTYDNALEAFSKKGYEVIYEPGYCIDKSKKDNSSELLEKAVQQAKKAVENNIPVVLFCGLTDYEEGEGFDRKDLLLPQNQIDLIDALTAVSTNLGTVTFSGSPVDLYFENKVQAILHMYLAGQGVGEACVNLISGQVNPSGKLAETFPLKIEDTPCYGHFGEETDTVEYNEGIFVGYRHYDTFGIPVRFPFGYGLSYTTFEYSDLKVELPKVSFTVKNTGKVAGAEVAQVYVAPVLPAYNKDEAPLFAKKELKGFDKVFLEPGEAKTVTIELDSRAFSAFSVEKKNFVQLGGKFTIYAGASSENLKLEAEVSVNGEDRNAVISAPVVMLTSTMNAAPKKFTISNSLGDMAQKSKFIRMFLFFAEIAIIKMNKGKSKEDPAVKIAISNIKENPLESLISTSGGMINEKLAKFLVSMSKI